MLLGLAEDYRKVMLNIRQNLFLIRSNSDKGAGFATEKNVTLSKIYWKIPHINPGLNEEVALTKYIGKNSYNTCGVS